MKNTTEIRVDRLEWDLRRALGDVDALRQLVRKLLQDNQQQRPQISGDGPGTVNLGITTSAAAARNGNVFPMCTVKMTMPVAATDLSSATNTDQGKPDIKAYNWTGTAFAVGALVEVVRMQGIWMVQERDCSTVTVPAPATAAPLVTQSNTPVTTQSNQQMTSQ